MCISIELYEIVQLWSGDGVALPLSLIIGIDRWHCRPDVEGGPLIRSLKKKR